MSLSLLAYSTKLFAPNTNLTLVSPTHLVRQALVDPMYQYSLAYFTKLFNHCIDAAEPSDELPTRLANLINFTTEFMYKMVCR